MRGIVGHPADLDRHAGVMKALSEFPNIKLLPSNDGVGTDWSPDKGTQLINDLINSGGYDNIQGIWTSGIDQQVVDAIKAAGKPFVPIVGADLKGFVEQLLNLSGNYDGLEGLAVYNPAAIGGAGALDCLLDALRPACLGDPVRSGVGLETTAVAAAARRALGIERLVTHLAARAVATLIDAAIDGDDPADTGPEREADHGAGSAACPESKLGQPERPGVVDHRGRQAQRVTDGTRHRLSRPGPRDVHEEAGRAGRRVVQPRDADADAAHPRAAADRLRTDLGEPCHHTIRTLGRRCPDLVSVEHPPVVSVVLHDDSLDIRPAEIETEVAARGLAAALGHQVSPVTRA